MSIFKRTWKKKDGSTAEMYCFHRTIDGVRHRIRLKTARTKAQATSEADKILSQIHEESYGKPKSSSVFIDFAEKVYLPWSKENKRSTSDQ